MPIASLGGVVAGAGGGSGISSLVGSVFGTAGNTSTNSTTNTQQLSDEDMQNLQNLIGTLGQNDAQFSAANAKTDAQGFADEALKQLTEQGLPQLLANQTTAGAYNTTSSKQLADDLTSRTAEQVSANTTNVITQYAQQRAQNDAVLAQLYQILKGSKTTSTTKASTDNSTEGLIHSLNPAQGILPDVQAGEGGLFNQLGFASKTP